MSAKKKGIAFLWNRAKIGMKIIIAIIIECVGPRCLRNGINKSMSGMTDNIVIIGMLIFVLRNFAEALPEIYPNAKWPTANDLFSSDYHCSTCFSLCF
jgi:acetone carboxylase gamma subunit